MIRLTGLVAAARRALLSVFAVALLAGQLYGLTHRIQHGAPSDRPNIARVLLAQLAERAGHAPHADHAEIAGHTQHAPPAEGADSDHAHHAHGPESAGDAHWCAGIDAQSLTAAPPAHCAATDALAARFHQSGPAPSSPVYSAVRRAFLARGPPITYS